MNALASHPALAKARGGAFYLHGEGLYRKEEVLRALIATHLDPATGDFNLDLLRGTDVDAETLASVLATPPMMAEWRVVVLRDVEGLAGSKKAREVLLHVVASPPPGLALLMSCTVPGGSKAQFYKELARTARSVEFRAVNPHDVPGWILERAREVHGIEFEVEAAQRLGAAIGVDLGILARELEKLADYVGDRARVSVEDVEATGTVLPTQDRWAWMDLVGERRFDEALRTLGTLFGQGETGVYLVMGLATHFLRLGMVAETGARGLEDILASNQRWVVKKMVLQARRWRPAQIDGAIEGLLRADRLYKSSSHAGQHFVEEWILGLMTEAA